MRTYLLAIKYWIQGETWGEALAYAKVITMRWGK